MTNLSQVLCLIPARGGSKGIPGKNIKPLNGKPLIAYAIDNARKIFADEQICVSTDDAAIRQVVEDYGLRVPFLRPAHLAQDTSGSYEVLLHALEYYEKQGRTFSTLVLLQPTSPFRKSWHIAQAMEAYSPELDMVVSVKEAAANPYYSLFEENAAGFLNISKKANFVRRQDCPKVFEYNGAVYVINVASLKQRKLNEFSRVRKYVMDDMSSLDVDTMTDWNYCEFLLTQELVSLD